MRPYISSNLRFHPRRRPEPPPVAIAPARLYVRREDGEWVELRGARPHTPPAALRDFDASGFAVSSPQPLDPAVFDAVLGYIHAALEVIGSMAAPPEPPPPPAPGPRWHLAWTNTVTGDEGRTVGEGWPTRAAAESAMGAFMGAVPDRVWWPVQESEASDG